MGQVEQLNEIERWINSGLFKGKLLNYLLKRKQQIQNKIKKGA